MDILKQHEMFEIEVLDRMKRARLLEPLIFGGDTMLRLCHELPAHIGKKAGKILKKSIDSIMLISK